MKRILLIEDDPLLSEMYKMVLEDEGYQIDNVQDGQTALQQNLERIDLVLLDVRIPEVDGMDVLRAYRKKGFQTPIVILTNSPQVDYEHARNLGADGFYVKSHTKVEDVAAMVEKYIR